MAAEPTPYAERLREALHRDGWSQLRLVKALADRTGNGVESERSSVRSYLKGSLPRPARAKMIAEIIGDPGLAQVDDPRQSATARIDAHLEALAAALAQLLDSQIEVHTKLDTLLADGQQRQQAGPT